MTKRDFELIARTLRSNQNTSTKGLAKYYTQICTDFADELQKTNPESNPEFDRPKFLKACGLS